MLQGAPAAPQSDFGKGRNVNLKDRTGHDFVNWSNMNDEVTLKAGKRANNTHKAAQNAGNFLKWDA